MQNKLKFVHKYGVKRDHEKKCEITEKMIYIKLNILTNKKMSDFWVKKTLRGVFWVKMHEITF